MQSIDIQQIIAELGIKLVPMALARPGHRAVLYARISEVRNAEAAGVTRQLKDEWALAQLRDYDVVAVRADNDITALKEGVRPGYREVTGIVGRGEIDFVVCWQMSRLLRNRKERAAFIELGATHRVGIVCVKGMDLNLTDATSRGMTAIMGEFDTMESEIKSERVLREMEDRIELGLPLGGLGFGWTPEKVDGKTVYLINEDEADVVRQAIRNLLAGDSLKAVTGGINAAGIPTPRKGKGWEAGKVRQLILRPSNVGLLTHRPGGRKGTVTNTYPGCWPAIVDRDEWDRAVKLLTDPARRVAPRPGARKYLLTAGIGQCGVCGGFLRGKYRQSRSSKVIYTCQLRGCVGRSQKVVDTFADVIMIGLLSRDDFWTWAVPDETALKVASTEVVRLRRKLAANTERWNKDLIDDEQYDLTNAELKPRLEVAKAEEMRLTTDLDLTSAADIVGERAEANWGALTLERKVKLIKSLHLVFVVDRVTRRDVANMRVLRDGQPI